MRRLKLITASLVAILIISLVAACYVVGNTMFHTTMQLTKPAQTDTATAAFLYQRDFNRRRFESDHTISSVEIPSSSGYAIPAELIAGGDQGIVIMVHDTGVNRASVYPVARIFLGMGYDVLAYDQRSAGENSQPYTTYGYLESRDVVDCVRWAREQQLGEIVLWGVSYGGAAVGLSLDDVYVQEAVKAAILDSPVSNMRDMLLTGLEGQTSPIPTDFWMAMGNLVTRLRLGFWYEDADVRRSAAESRTPLLVLTSRSDTVTPFYMGDEIYNAVPHGLKRIYTVTDSAHGQLYYDQPEVYAALVQDFLHAHY